MLNRVKVILGLDRSISNTLLLRFSMASCSFITIFFVSIFLTQEIQGYYYTFNSLIGLQVFVELGFNFAIVQIVSHEMARLSWNQEGVLFGHEESKRRLQSLVQYIYTWFSIACPLIIILILPAGLYFFSRNEPVSSTVNEGWAWAILVIATAYALLVNTALAVLEGCNKVAEVALIRVLQNIGASIATCLALSAHFGLYSLAMGAIVSGSIGTVALYKNYRAFYSDIWYFKSHGEGINFRREVWPFQWRIAVSWASGYLIFQIFNPLLFATHGPVAAGKMGMTLQITGGLTSIASAWMSTKAPLFGRLIALGKRSELNLVFRKAIVQSTLVLFALCLTTTAVLYFLQGEYPSYAQRLLPPVYVAILCFIAIANHLNAAEASYLRAYKEDPFMIVSLANALVITSLSLVLIKPYGFMGAILAYGSGAIAINLGFGTMIFYKKYCSRA